MQEYTNEPSDDDRTYVTKELFHIADSAQGNEIRADIGRYLRTEWTSLRHEPFPEAVDFMRQLVYTQLKSAETCSSDIARITYVEALDILDRKA